MSTSPTSAADLSVEWYYVASSGEQSGPVNIDELRYLFHKQLTNNDCLCWTEQLPGWTLIRDVDQLQQHFASKPNPPPLPTPSTIQLALPPLNTATNTASAAAGGATSPTAGGGSGRSTMSRKTGQLVAQHAKYKTLGKKERGSGGVASSSLKGSAVSDMIGAAQKKYGTLKVSKSTTGSAAMNTNILSPASPLNTAQVVPVSGEAVVSPRHASTCSTPTAATSAVFDAFQAASAATPAVVDPASYPPSQSPDVISSNLITAITQLDADALTTQLAAGDAIQLDEQHYVASPLARMYAAKLDEVRGRMREAVRVMDEVLLCQAVYAAEAIGYNKLDVVSCRKLRDAVVQLNVEAKQQLVVLDERKMRNIISRAEQLSITSTTTTTTSSGGNNNNATIEQLRILLDSTSEEKFRQLQLKAANALGDKHRATRLTISLKQMVHKRTAHMFTLDSYAKWRESDEWASEKLGLGGKKELADGMKRWTRDTIHASLTKLTSKELNKLACKAFKRLLVYCGDRSSDGGDKSVASYDVLRELLDIGLQHAPLRDELFIQLMKQLTANPNTDSERRVWTAMYCALETFPPGSDLENILEIFLSKHVLYGSAAINMLHHTLYDGPRRCVPSEAEVAVMAAGKSIRHCAYEDEREYYTWRAVLPQPAEVQPLAGTKAATMRQFIESGGVPDWSEIDIRIPTAEHWQQPDFKLEIKPKKAPPSPASRIAASSTSVANAVAAVTATSAPAAAAAASVAMVSSSQLSTAINSPAGSRPVTQPSTPRNARLVVDTAAPPPLLSAVAPLSPLPLSPISPSLAPPSPSSATSASVAPSTSVSSSSSSSASSSSSHSSTSTLSSASISDIPEPPPLLSTTSALSMAPPPRAVCLWAKTLDPSSGQPYFYHTETMEVTWDQPADYFE